LPDPQSRNPFNHHARLLETETELAAINAELLGHNTAA
jgi:hypothetical protein